MSVISHALDTNDLADKYDQINRNYQFPAGQKLVDKAAITPGSTCLDIGCGTGDLALYIATKVGSNGMVYAFDPLTLRVERARRKLFDVNADRQAQGLWKLNVLFQVGKAEKMRKLYSDMSMDYVFMNSVFHWFRDQFPALKLVHGILKPGGLLAMAGGSGDDCHPQSLRRIVLQKEPYCFYPQKGMSNLLKEKALQQLLTDAGFGYDIKPVDVSLKFANYEAFGEFQVASTFGNQSKLDMPDKHAAMAQKEIDDGYKALEKGDGGGLVIDVVQYHTYATKL